jgi:hypothetical protein
VANTAYCQGWVGEWDGGAEDRAVEERSHSTLVLRTLAVDDEQGRLAPRVAVEDLDFRGGCRVRWCRGHDVVQLAGYRDGLVGEPF